MTKFLHLTNNQKNAAARDAVLRVLAGSRMRQLDAEALQHAASLIELFIAPEPNDLRTELVGPPDIFDHLATQNGGSDGV